MDQEIKNCQNCKKNFTIDPEDFQFYEKIKVPAPTWCPECRMIRRMLWRNEAVWYRRKCDATGKSVLSVFTQDSPYKVYEQAYWRSDAWDPMAYGKDYDFSKTFFEQFNKLLIDIPHPNLIQKNVVSSDYVNIGVNLKNCYFVGGADGAEDSAYLFSPNLRNRDCFDIYSTRDTERTYDSTSIEKSQGLRFCQDCIACSDSYLLYDCKNCMNCFGCVGLRNKQFCIFNKQYSREDYQAEIEKIAPYTYSGFLQAKAEFDKLKLKFPRKFASIIKAENVTGDEINNVRNCINCFDVKFDVQNCKHSFRVFENSADGYDAMAAWDGAELFYEVMSITAQRVIGSALIWGGFDILYSYNCFDCNNIFGCVGLHNKSYCILNKQFTKEEYDVLAPKIIEQMKKAGEYGEFFPPKLSPFAYNETLAQDYFPKTKEQVLAMGMRWRDSKEKKYNITMKNNQIPNDIRTVDDLILNEIIECGHNGNCSDHCATAFRIIPQELQFLKKMNVPLPRLCPLCRQGERVRLKNPMHLWHRKCMKSGCQNEFETPYAPDRPEIVYCETCYNNEVA